MVLSSLGHGWRLGGLTHGARPAGVFLSRDIAHNFGELVTPGLGAGVGAHSGDTQEGVLAQRLSGSPVCDPVGMELEDLLDAFQYDDAGSQPRGEVGGRVGSGQDGDGSTKDHCHHFERLIANAIAGGCPLVPAELGIECLPQGVVPLGGSTGWGRLSVRFCQDARPPRVVESGFGSVVIVGGRHGWLSSERDCVTLSGSDPIISVGGARTSGEVNRRLAQLSTR